MRSRPAPQARPITRDQFIELGEALFGRQWQSDVARALGVSDRQLRRWVAGTAPIPPGVSHDLKIIASERAAAIRALADAIDDAPAPSEVC